MMRYLLLILQTMRYLAILPQDRGSDGKHDWSAIRFCFDEEVRPLPRTHWRVQLLLGYRLFTMILPAAPRRLVNALKQEGNRTGQERAPREGSKERG